MPNNALRDDSARSSAVSSAKATTPVAALLNEDTAERAGKGEVGVMSNPIATSLESSSNTQINHNLRLPHSIPSPSPVPTVSQSNTAAKWPVAQDAECCSYDRAKPANVSSEESSNVLQKNSRQPTSSFGSTHSHSKRSRRFVVYLQNSLGTVHKIKVRDTDSVRRVKEKASMGANIFLQSIHLFFNGVELNNDHETVQSLGISEGCILHLAPRLQSGQMEMVEGCAFSDQTLYEKVVSHLTEKQLEQLSSGSLNKTVSFVAIISGKRCLVRVKAAGDGGANQSSLHTAPTSDTASDNVNSDSFSKGTGPGEGRRKDFHWQKEKQIEHKAMRACMDDLCDRMKQSNAARGQAKKALISSRNVAVDSKNISSSSTEPAPDLLSPASIRSPKDAARCHSCSRKLGPLRLPCRCTYTYCSVHRYDHECSFDFRTGN